MSKIGRWLKRTMTWWTDSTLGTALTTWRHGVAVGSDEQGNRYYKSKTGDRRWVIYNGEIEASRVPPEWHAWLHHLVECPPSERPLIPKPWEKPHRPNMTGTIGAYHPPGSLEAKAERPHATGDYEPWTP